MKIESRKNNNFDLLRLILALMVFLAHASILSQAQELGFIGEYISATVAVQGFFVISGFLIFCSYENSNSISHYAIKRVARIYPAYFIVIILAILIGSMITSADQYFGYESFKYFFANIVFLNFLHPTLPGVFEGNYINAINGSLWTLKIEVMFCASVPIIIWLAKYIKRSFLFVGIFILSCLYNIAMQHLAEKTGSGFYKILSHQLPAQMTYFIAGAACYYWFELFAKYKNILLGLSIILYCAAEYVGMLSVWLRPLVIAIWVIYFAYFIVHIGNFSKYGDFSYGVYITHFPIIQMLVSYGLFEESAIKALFVSAALVFISSFVLWHLVESKALNLAHGYVKKKRNVDMLVRLS
ncbi:acyltransferase [Rickettsiales bacterium]|nr:acyltransferase [Rickettsiales bacterium]